MRYRFGTRAIRNITDLRGTVAVWPVFGTVSCPVYRIKAQGGSGTAIEGVEVTSEKEEKRTGDAIGSANSQNGQLAESHQINALEGFVLEINRDVPFRRSWK